MSVSNGKITAPVSIEDIKTVLGESSNDLATLCKSNNINMWSKKKPVRLYKTFPDINSTWYRADDDDLGIQINKGADTNLGTLYAGASFVYKKPQGGYLQPFRMSDFIGYNHNAKPFLYCENLGSVAVVDAFTGETSTNILDIKKGDIDLYDFSENNVMRRGWLYMEYLTCNSSTYDPNNLNHVAYQFNDTTHQIGAGYTYIVNPNENEEQKVKEKLMEYSKFGDDIRHAVLLFMAIQYNSNLFPIYFDNNKAPYITLYKEYKLFANAKVSNVSYKIDSIVYDGDSLGYTIKLTSNNHNSLCFGVTFNVDKYTSGLFTFNSATSFNTLTGLHRFRLIQYYGTGNNYYAWYPTLYDSNGVKQSSMTIGFSSIKSVSLIIAFEYGDNATNKKVFSTITYGQNVTMALQYSGDNGNNWMDIKTFDVHYY